MQGVGQDKPTIQDAGAQRKGETRTTYRTNIIPLIPEPVMPLVRTAYYGLLGVGARAGAKLKPAFGSDVDSPIFIIGCGRSGTTLLGEICAMHPEVRYIYEPYNRWAAIHPVTDFLGLYNRAEHHCMLDASFASASTIARFRRLMSPPRDKTLVEKSPINALRLGFLNAIAPKARFVHIMRDGVEVVRSIERMASITRPMAFRPPLNDWWGVDGEKWATLSRDGKAAGYYADEVPQLFTDVERGAYEWLVSMHEIEAWRTRLGGRLIELRLDDLSSAPKESLKTIFAGLGFSVSDEWLDRASEVVHPTSSGLGKVISLPARMVRDFNGFQEKYDFKGRAVPNT